ncbi:MAG: hypothetical protein ABSF71_24430 [Terriglobia bacterium]
MSSFKRTSMFLVLALAVAASAWAQRGGRGGMGMMGSLPKMPGLSNPVVGSGAEYQMTTKGKDMDVAWAIVGKEDVSGNPGIWIETRMQSPDVGGEMVSKMLMVTTGPEAGMKRMIMQQPGQPPMEMTGMMMGLMKGGQAQPSSSGGKAEYGELVGTETITVPAGTYACQHYRKQEKSGPVDYWVSDQITPYAMAKMTGPDVTMVLKKTLTDETTHIKGEPQKFQLPQIPH